MVTKLVCSTLKKSQVSNDSLPSIIIAEVRIVILNHVSPCCFQTFLKQSCYVLLEEKQNDKSGGVDISWILPTFDHDLYIFSKSFICIWSLFRAFTCLGTHLGKLCFWSVLEPF